MPKKLIVYIPDDLAAWVDAHKHIIHPCDLLEKQLEMARIGPRRQSPRANVASPRADRAGRPHEAATTEEALSTRWLLPRPAGDRDDRTRPVRPRPRQDPPRQDTVAAATLPVDTPPGEPAGAHVEA